MKFKCKICGYVCEADQAPDICPKCQKEGVMEALPKNKYAGTKTEKNLQEAFAGESMARNKYTYFASVAKKSGYEQIAALFLKTVQGSGWYRQRGGKSSGSRRG